MKPETTLVDRFLFKLHHWHVFMLICFTALLAQLLPERYSGLYWLSQSAAYPILLGIRLKRFLPSSFNNAYRLFLMSGGISSCIMTLVTLRMLWAPNWALLVIMDGASVIFYFTMITFTVKAMRHLQDVVGLQKISIVVDYLMLIFFFPLGLWFLQPRLNALGDQLFRD